MIVMNATIFPYIPSGSGKQPKEWIRRGDRAASRNRRRSFRQPSLSNSRKEGGHMKKGKRRLISRRDFIKAAGVGTLAAGIAPQIILPGRGYAAGKDLKILVWSHFVPRFDQEGFDGFAKKGGGE